MKLTTPLATKLGPRYPLVAAPMFLISNGSAGQGVALVDEPRSQDSAFDSATFAVLLRGLARLV